jgi:hypothetical protein
MAQADAALKIGQSAPQIEQGLIAKGLSPAVATAVVTAVLESRLHASYAASEPSDGALMAHRVASAVVACLCLGLALMFGGGLSAAKTALWLLLPVACIWWAEMLESVSPPILIRWTAWVVLVLIGVYRVVLLLL